MIANKAIGNQTTSHWLIYLFGPNKRPILAKCIIYPYRCSYRPWSSLVSKHTRPLFDGTAELNWCSVHHSRQQAPPDLAARGGFVLTASERRHFRPCSFNQHFCWKWLNWSSPVRSCRCTSDAGVCAVSQGGGGRRGLLAEPRGNRS